MRLKRIIVRAALCLVASVAASVALVPLSTASAADLDTIRLRTDWTPWGIDAALYLAKQKGWFARAGIAVDAQDGIGSTHTVQLVGAGQFDAGLANLGPMIIGRDRGLPVIAIADFVRQNDTGVLVPANENWRTPKDLVGRRIAITPGGSGAPFFDRFFANGGVAADQVTRLNVDAAAQTAIYIAGRVDGTVSSIPFFLPIVAAQRPSRAIRFADFGLPLPSFGLFTNEKALAAKRAALGRFASVMAGAWQYIEQGHQDEAVAAMLAQRPDVKLDPKILRGQIDQLLGFMHTPATQGQPTGYMAESDWQGALKTLGDAKLLKNPEPADHYFTNTLLDRATIDRIGAGK
ncbi:ABC transporter substrate-binding protein [Robbsia sp. Bb-Pol-6]|uniref:Thiamine pyrimidine synthase n=1 Tax=Robbsia betulipollinis TaxID=2981849 RepID=A0ABT3ZKT2_9BURK|nr:ABC transporter substrate-binding protein [Robbsia betulipollinis]MCY0386957.1 ABC transporter substrate-binding protein [Robbsia betulipollinis]